MECWIDHTIARWAHQRKHIVIQYIPTITINQKKRKKNYTFIYLLVRLFIHSLARAHSYIFAQFIQHTIIVVFCQREPRKPITKITTMSYYRSGSNLSEKCGVNFAFHVSWIFFFHLNSVDDAILNATMNVYVCVHIVVFLTNGMDWFELIF